MSRAISAIPQFSEQLVSVDLIVSRVATAMLEGISLSALRWKSGSTAAGAARSAFAHAPRGASRAPPDQPGSRRCRRPARRCLGAGLPRLRSRLMPRPPRCRADRRGRPQAAGRGPARSRAARPANAEATSVTGGCAGPSPVPGREGRREVPVAPQLAGHVGARDEGARRRLGAAGQKRRLIRERPRSSTTRRSGVSTSARARHRRLAPTVGHAPPAAALDPQRLDHAPDRPSRRRPPGCRRRGAPRGASCSRTSGRAADPAGSGHQRRSKMPAAQAEA